VPELLGRLETKVWQHDPTVYAPARFRRACQYDVFIPYLIEGLEISLSGSLEATISQAESAIQDLNSASQGILAPMARLLLRTESIASSKVEGMQVEARALARAAVAKDTGQRASQTALEVLANVDAMRKAIDDATSEKVLDVNQIIEIHRALLTRATNSHIAGKIRIVQNWIGGNDYNPCGADFVPPPPEEVGELLNDLCRFCAQDRWGPLVQAAIAHAQFETIHPFEDGNGRTGRALVQVILRRRGLAPSYVPPISVVLANNREQYIAGLTAYREGRLEAWLEVFAVATANAANLAREYLNEVESLQNNWREQLRLSTHVRSDAAAWALINELPSQPVITLPVAVSLVGRSKPAVNQAISQLASAGVLVPMSSGQRNRAWEAAGLLDLISRLESGESPDAVEQPATLPDVSPSAENSGSDQVLEAISTLAFSDPIYRLAPGSWLIPPGEAELTLRVAAAMPSVLPIGGMGSQQAGQLRAQEREALLSSLLETSPITAWLRSLGQVWHWPEDSQPTWTPVGAGSMEFTELWFAPFGIDAHRPSFMARCAFATGFADDESNVGVPTIQGAIDLLFNLQELGADRRPDAVRNASDNPPVPSALSLQEIAEDLIEMCDTVPVISQASDGLLASRSPSARVGIWVSLSGVLADRLIDLRAFRRVPRSAGLSQAVGAFRIQASNGRFDFPKQDARTAVADVLYRALENGGYRDVDEAIEAIRSGN
jgi:Fic family protein